MKTRHGQVTPYITKDGTEIRELMHPAVHGALGARRQSLAEARLPVGARSLPHRHADSEEIYHISAGTGRMMLAGDWFDITAGDTVVIPPGTAHGLHNTGQDTLVVLCACSPPYDHADTDLL